MAKTISKDDKSSKKADKSSSAKKSSRQENAENRVAEISALLRSLEGAAFESGLVAEAEEVKPRTEIEPHDNQSVQVPAAPAALVGPDTPASAPAAPVGSDASASSAAAAAATAAAASASDASASDASAASAAAAATTAASAAVSAAASVVASAADSADSSQVSPLVQAPPPVAQSTSDPRSLFEQKLLDSMHDGVVFVDSQVRICMWSTGAERLTGVSSGAAIGRAFAPSLLDMRNDTSRRILDEDCPVAKSLLTNTQLRQRLLIKGRQEKYVAIDLHAIPVLATDGTVRGVTVLLQDAQSEASLEEKCDELYAEVTKDPLTKVANRAEFDRMHGLFIEAHQQASQPCSLIMADIDHFKIINDNYGHQAGDEAIISTANLLSSMSRSGDLVARYGGEEFVLLCADCSNADAARRAEQIRKKLADTQHASLGNKRITASFGVTELQSGDTSESMLGRSDRALLMAKEQGRNQVVQLGNGMEEEKPKKKWWQFGGRTSQPVVESTLVTIVPFGIVIEKLRGFISDHKAKVVATDENTIEIQVSSETVSHDRRKNDRHTVFCVKLQINEDRLEKTNSHGGASGELVQTRIELSIRPKRAGRGRKSDQAERAGLLLQSIKAYLMAKESDEARAELVATAGN